MKAFKLMPAGLALVLASCATTGPGEAAQEAETSAGAIDCSSYSRSDAPLVFHAMDPNIPSSWPASRVVTPAGVSIPISVGQLDRRQFIEPVPLQCMEWQLETSDNAQLSDDGSAIEVAGHAEPGSEILLTGTIRGSEGDAGSETLRILIIDETTRQLIGTWSFDAARDCDRADVNPPLEIRFEVNNGLSVTWTPFGRYWDYWGQYEWSPESGAFTFASTGGNRIPPDISANGQMVQEGDRHLAFSGFHFGTIEADNPGAGVSVADAGCTLVFRRQGDAP